jgi:hypothetical protein
MSNGLFSPNGVKFTAFSQKPQKKMSILQSNDANFYHL